MVDHEIIIHSDALANAGLPPLDVARHVLTDQVFAVLAGNLDVEKHVGALIQTLDFAHEGPAPALPDVLPSTFGLRIDSVSCYGLVARMVRTGLPGWWFRLGQCHLSTDIALGPDYNDPLHGERLRRDFPESFWDGGLDFDIRPPVSDAAGLAFGLLAALQRIADIQDAVKQGSLTWPE